MRIALVHDFLLKLGGAERVLRVLADMFPDAPIYTFLYDEEKVGKIFPKERIITSYLQKLPKFFHKKYRFFLPFFPRITEKFDFTGFDVVISSSSAFSHGILTPSNTKHICYCHSPMRYVWDYKDEYLKEQKFGKITNFIATKILKGIRAWDQIAGRRPDLYIANSEHVKKRIYKYFRQDSTVIYPPVDIKRFKTTKKNDGYFLIVSTLSPYKKIDLAIKLFNKINKKLIIIGDGSHKKYLETISSKNVHVLGFKSDSEAAKYLENCRALIFPGEEDFGITPIEAMACGKPVLAYAKGGALETIESGKSGEFFYQQTVESMEEGLAKFLINEDGYNPQEIRKKAERFDKNVFETEIKKIVKKLC